MQSHNNRFSIAGPMLIASSLFYGLAMTAVGWGADDARFDAQIREIQKSTKKTTDNDELRSLANDLLTVSDAAVAEDDYVNATKAITLAAGLGTKTANRQLIFRTKQRKDEVQQMANEFRALAKSMKKLMADPNDAESNRKVGLYLTAWKSQWQRGSELLAKTEPPLLRKISDGETNPPDAVDGQIALGQAWQEASESEMGTLRSRMLKRAYYWYQTAWRKATEDVKENIDKRMVDMPFRYLTDMDEKQGGEGPWGFAKYGATGGDNRISIDGIKYELGLGMSPGPETFLSAQYQLNGKYKSFNAGYGLNDLEFGFGGVLRFSVIGDGRVLWKSQPVKIRNDADFIAVDIKGIKVLEIRTECSQVAQHCHAVWLDPYVTK